MGTAFFVVQYAFFISTRTLILKFKFKVSSPGILKSITGKQLKLSQCLVLGYNVMQSHHCNGWLGSRGERRLETQNTGDRGRCSQWLRPSPNIEPEIPGQGPGCPTPGRDKEWRNDFEASWSPSLVSSTEQPHLSSILTFKYFPKTNIVLQEPGRSKINIINFYPTADNDLLVVFYAESQI